MLGTVQAYARKSNHPTHHQARKMRFLLRRMPTRPMIVPVVVLTPQR